MGNSERSQLHGDGEHPPARRENEPLFTLTLGEVQSVAQAALGRELSGAELDVVMSNFRKALAWLFHLENSIQAGLEQGTIEPNAPEHPLDDQTHPAPEANPDWPSFIPPEVAAAQFLVYYKLSGLMLATAADARQASEEVFGTLHTLVGRSERMGVTPHTASQLRLGELEVEIDSVEALEFPSDDSAIAPVSPQQVEATSNRADLADYSDMPAPPDEFYDIYASVSLADLDDLGFDTTQVTAQDMNRLARKMTQDYLDNMYRQSLKTNAEDIGIAKLTNPNNG